MTDGGRRRRGTPRLRIHENGGKAVPDTPWPDDFDLVALALSASMPGRGVPRPANDSDRRDGARGLGEARATEARRLDCLLHVQPKVDDVGKHLQAALRLAVAAGGPERHVGLPLLQHDEGARRCPWPLVRRQDVGVVRIEPEVASPAVDQDACVTQNHPRPGQRNCWAWLRPCSPARPLWPGTWCRPRRPRRAPASAPSLGR